MAQPIRVALIGVGNCASSLVQGLGWYGDAAGDPEDNPGLMHQEVEGYRPSDIEIVAAFDVATTKVGRDLSDAIFAEPNNTRTFYRPEPSGVIVERGPRLDGIGATLEDTVPLPERHGYIGADGVMRSLRESGAQIVVNYLPVGSQSATEFYAACAMGAGCSFVNCIPVFLANDPKWVALAESHRVVLAGDDIKSQYGATIVHQRLVELLAERGIRLDRTYQLNFGGNTDFKNMLDQSRLATKRESKTRAVTDAAGRILAPEDVHIGPSDYVPWLGDRKWALIRLEATAFGGSPLMIECKLEVWDSPNSAGVVIDVLRRVAGARSRGETGLLRDQEPYFKAPGRIATAKVSAAE